MKNARHYDLHLSDLTEAKREELIKDILPKIQATAEEEGRKYLAQNWAEPVPETWQEAYCRKLKLEYALWKDEEAAKKIVTPGFIWETWQEAHVRHMAQAKLIAAFQLLELEVSI